MPTPAERQALVFLAVVLSLGTGVRIVRGRAPAPTPSAREALAGQLAAVDSAIATRGRRGRRPAPLSPSSPSSSPAPSRPTVARVDLDTAPESVLVTLPGIGPALAQRIIRDRERHGAFGSLTALTRVGGIGERSAARLAPHVTFSGAAPRPR
jgi:competence protein ComEA